MNSKDNLNLVHSELILFALIFLLAGFEGLKPIHFMFYQWIIVLHPALVIESHPFIEEDDVFLLNRLGEDNLSGDINFSMFDTRFLSSVENAFSSKENFRKNGFSHFFL